ncbi:methionine synthase I (cobalamin-dependent) [Anaerosolibacter carboniphilus]|uniref:Methionine synthase I (Cobalamin-dependent) n=1 Tax=Anaerosolibacter carboniphilus TaxID=1417629 RepID=A0A841KPR8_9FIRM|nr:homocysteine S-methyltransferase family protein [Anaerosolibacter carboniphilus]MBB6214090.1 methionine synthase I (cobalamin-dependent) [Anaerosolibacter carboniphilus]
MMQEKLYRRMEEQVLIFDGAMGTMLLARGLKMGQCLEGFNLECPDIIFQIHREYIEAGADIIQTNTFGANRIRLKDFQMESKLMDINQKAVDIAYKAAKDACFVAGNIGPVGKRWNDVGEEEIYQAFYQQAKILIDEGVELINIETMTDLREALLAVKAVKDIKDIPTICSMSFGKGLKTFDGSTPEKVVQCLMEKGADIIGSNCGSDISDMLMVMEKMIQTSSGYWIVQPNAGMPKKIENQMVYSLTPEEMGCYGRRFAELGINIIGGCCGTTPAHIQVLHEVITSMK